MPEVSYHDNRGTEDGPFGFVYFTDGETRLGFAPGTSGIGNPLGLFPSRGWGSPHHEHYEAAKEYLISKGIS